MALAERRDPDDDLTVASSPAGMAAAVASGTVLAGGRYRIVSEAKAGGMGAVAEAVDTLLDRRVAV